MLTCFTECKPRHNNILIAVDEAQEVRTKQLASKEEFYSYCCFVLQNVCLQIVQVSYILMVVISWWAIILHNMSHLIISFPLLSESKY